jgi:hypothetical protein
MIGNAGPTLGDGEAMTAANNLDLGGRPCSALCSKWNSRLRPAWMAVCLFVVFKDRQMYLPESEVRMRA